MLENKKIVVIGGAGFVGSSLCQVLASNNKVVSIDNYFTGKKENHVNGVNYINGCASKISDYISYDVDLVFHFGEYSRVEQSFGDFDFVMENNFATLHKVLTFCKNRNAKLVYSGSSTKFTSDEEGILQSPYAFTKACNTQLINGFSKWFGLDFAIVYFYNVYGPKEIANGKYATLIAKFLDMAREGKPLTVTSPGTQSRNFTHINDIVDGILLVAELGAGDLYGIGSDESFRIIDVAKLISDDIKFVPEKAGNRTGASVINQKLKDLGWSTKHNLKSYIEDQIN